MKQAGTFQVEGEVGVRGVVSVSVLGELAASLDISAEELYVRLYETGVRLESDGAAPGFGSA